MRWRYRPEVEPEVEEIVWGYEAARAGLGAEFLDELERLYRKIDAFPSSYQEVLPGIRRGVLRRFPYLVYYTKLGESIEVIAVLHHARHERVWKQRL